MTFMRVKSAEQSIRDAEAPEFRLRRVLSAWDLLGIGIGAIIGTGIFVLTGVAAATDAGPGIAISFVISGIACGLAALCYAEFASVVPVAGSAYTFSYASLGEFLAWIIGWDLVLEFIIGASTVSVGWSQYFVEALSAIGLGLPPAMTAAPGAGGVVNLPAAVIALLLTIVLVVGIRLSSAVTNVVVAIKLAVVLFFIIFGAFFVKAANWSPFIPPHQPPDPGAAGSALDEPLINAIFGATGSYGLSGLVAGAALVFFAYIGFDIVASGAEETRKPQRDMPIGILGSLAVCSVLYVLVSLVMTGIVKYTQLDTAAPMATAFQAIGAPWAVGLVSLGAIAGLTTVILILMLGQARVGFAMSRDGLLPVWFAKVHRKYRTPYRITLITGILVAIISSLTPIDLLAEMTNIGTLFAFVLVSAGVLVLRRSRPDLPRAFKVPWVPVIPILAVLSCLYLMLNLDGWTWIRFGIWMAIGLVVYFAYSARHSRLAKEQSIEEAAGGL
ncbi:amino acid/polyamine/organocation transporter (APC superfamily) [Saccharopolyspora erythraea NRRL 2338]|uniref:Amino acid permease-associated region n=2 Tax=Saccharopolyspora erythraea TaxID=1836 RepID=A4FL66_SACEN|nr:amino acid permease [Saccharopolyspora erythraea]EQD83740.1 amino acid permease [Saccharopolyspora erythraea D]PFG98431.1 amino acid/polyamine/organocation transporter (APC superfamily) [Saccharopolyspora erythraea NRRL 2338]QRK88497.1 amino acid permease [Saccharopolyspora erythraea]CAM04791.1 amino acid permease-associated region [Saccharopolyspora erythraea NRRL 2338]